VFLHLGINHSALERLTERWMVTNLRKNLKAVLPGIVLRQAAKAQDLL
jgi:hypothetical protein